MEKSIAGLHKGKDYIDWISTRDYDSKGLPGETGANPVRARRRKAYLKYCWPDIPTVYKPEATIRGKAIGAYLRRPASKMPSRNILAVQILYFITASASFMRK